MPGMLWFILERSKAAINHYFAIQKNQNGFLHPICRLVRGIFLFVPLHPKEELFWWCSPLC